MILFHYLNADNKTTLVMLQVNTGNETIVQQTNDNAQTRTYKLCEQRRRRELVSDLLTLSIP